MDRIFLALRDMSLEFPNGYTITFGAFEPIHEGWVVKMKGFENLYGQAGMETAMEVALKTSKTIGGWRDGELDFWDVVIIFDDEEEATKAGIKNGQMAIYQIETGRLKWLQ